MPFDLRMKSWSSFKRIIYGLWGISQVVFFSWAYFIYEQEHSTPTSIQIGGLHRPPHQMLVTYSLLLRRKQITANKQVQVFFCRYNSIAHQIGNIKKKKTQFLSSFQRLRYEQKNTLKIKRKHLSLFIAWKKTEIDFSNSFLFMIKLIKWKVLHRPLN